MGTSGTRLRVGLIGAGLVGQAAHAFFLWDDRERFDLVALADPSAAVRAAVGDRYGIRERHASLDDLLGLGLDAIVVAVPDAFHADVACQGLEAGLHVLCEKPLALSLEECDRIAAARDASGRVLQVGTMKRYDPAFLRMLELLPESPADVRYLSIEVRDPDQGPFVAHLPMTAATDLALELRQELQVRMAARIHEAAGGDPPAGGARAFEAYLSSLVHDVSLLQGVLEHLGAPWCEQADDGAWWDDGRAVSLSATLPGGGRAHLVHHNLPGVNDYSERLTLHCSDRVLELTFPSPYLRHEPTRLLEIRSDGAIGRRSTLHHVSYEEAFRQELRAFADACEGTGPVVTPVEAGRADVALLIELAVARRRRGPGIRRPRRWSLNRPLVGSFQNPSRDRSLKVGLFTDGLAHLERREALQWCAARGIEDLEMGVGTWSPRPHLDLARLLAEPAERDRLQGELREHGQRLACVNAAGNPLAPAPAARAEAQAALRGAIELAALLGVDTVVTMSGCPGGRGASDSTGVFAVSWLCCDDEPLWEWQFREHVVPFWRELSAWAESAAPELRICLELHPGLTIFGADSFARLRAEVGPNIGINLDPSHFWWQGVDSLAIVEAHGDAIGFAHGKDTLLHPERIRLNGLLDARYPIDPETASWHFAAVGGGRPLEEWWDLLAALRGAGYDGVVSIEHEDPTLSPEASIEASAVALREALAWQ